MKLIKILTLTIVLFAQQSSWAGDNYKEEDIKREISYLAKKLLDMSGKDSYEVSSEAVIKAYLGVCVDIHEAGIKLTCITPESGASRAGLQTGDLVIEINGLSMAGQKAKHKKHEGEYAQIFDNMQPGDKLKVKVMREGKEKSIDATVGSLSHPAFTLTIKGK